MKSDHRVEMNRQGLRVVQIVCILLALSACWLVAYLGRPKNNGEFGPIQWVIVLAAAYCACRVSHSSAISTKNPLDLNE